MRSLIKYVAPIVVGGVCGVLAAIGFALSDRALTKADQLASVGGFLLAGVGVALTLRAVARRQESATPRPGDIPARDAGRRSATNHAWNNHIVQQGPASVAIVEVAAPKCPSGNRSWVPGQAPSHDGDH